MEQQQQQSSRGRQRRRPRLPPPAIPEVASSPSGIQRRVLNTALDGAYRTVRFSGETTTTTLLLFLSSIRASLEETLTILTSRPGYEVKVQFLAGLRMEKMVQVEDEEVAHEIEIILSEKTKPADEVDLDSVFASLETKLEDFTQLSSGIRFLGVSHLDLVVVEYDRISPTTGQCGANFKLPNRLATKKAVISVHRK